MKDGGSAFPGIAGSYAGADEYQNRYTGLETYGGMSLRDYFAAATLTGFMETYHAPDAPDTPERRTSLAKLCYDVADAMIAERDSETPSQAELKAEGATDGYGG